MVLEFAGMCSRLELFWIGLWIADVAAGLEGRSDGHFQLPIRTDGLAPKRLPIQSISCAFMDGAQADESVLAELQPSTDACLTLGIAKIHWNRRATHSREQVALVANQTHSTLEGYSVCDVMLGHGSERIDPSSRLGNNWRAVG